jgi:2,3-bisphosphoglycerate-independent phosphoglycerate mutase
VTSFFNGKSTTPFEGEDQVDVPGRFDPAAFGSHPEMEAYLLTDELLRRLEDNPYSLVVVNYANGDMVGHTGDFEAAKKAIEVVDECMGRLLQRCKELDAHVLITADHGNSEEMIDATSGLVKTSHTLNPVECILVSNAVPQVELVKQGKLADLAPTILQLLDLDVPEQMTALSLIVD